MAVMPLGTITPRNNAESRRIWWSQPGRTLGRVLEHIRRTFDEDGRRKEKKRLRRASPVPLAIVQPDEEAPSRRSGRASPSDDLAVLSDSDDDDTTLAVVLCTGDAGDVGQSSSNAPGN